MCRACSFSSGTICNVGERAIAKRLVGETGAHDFLGSFITYLPIYCKTLIKVEDSRKTAHACRTKKNKILLR